METMRKVLVVEDVHFNLLLADSLLKVCGFEPKLVNNAKEALTLMKKEHFDLVLLDLMMPEMDGFEFLDHKQKRKDTTPVMVISAKTDEASINQAMGLGAMGYITKPYDCNDLKKKLNTYFSLPS